MIDTNRSDSGDPLEEIYARIKSKVPRVEWELKKPLVRRILELKRERNAAILAHTYMTPDIYFTVADIHGDSLALAREAAQTDADVIVLAGVKFMADTAKIVNPTKTVLIPDLEAGCSLAESITGEDVRQLKRLHPGVPVVTYVNTNADVKAESDICCTSSNAKRVVESLGVPKVIFLPDKYLGSWVASQTGVEVILWDGTCIVHERFTPADISELRSAYPDIMVLAHPECPENVLQAADFVGSTSAMIRAVDQSPSHRVALITECSMADNVAVMHPEKEFIRPCQLCPYMGKITLEKIAWSLENMAHEIVLPDDILSRARVALDRMLAVKSA